MSERTVRLIAAIRRNYGVRFGVATGRDKASVLPLLERTGLSRITDAAVTNNGVETLVRGAPGSICLPKVPRKKIREIVRYYEKVPGLKICFHNPDCFFTTRPDERSGKIAAENNRPRIADPRADESYGETPRVMLIFDPSDREKVKACVDAHSFSGLRLCLSEKDIYEYMDERVSKDRGIYAYVSQYRHDLSRVLAFGDSDNDVEMLRACGIGIAMKNGTRAAREAASGVTAADADEDGVFRFLDSRWELFEADPDGRRG